MTSKHLQYETSKTVMQYLDANLRFMLAQQAPTLRSIEKIVPLQIRNLVIGDASFKINETKYTFSVHRESLDGSKLFSEPDCDYDEFGFPMYPGRVNVLPGDIDLRDARALRVQWKNDTVEYEMILKLQLRHLTAQPWYFSGRDQKRQRAINDCRAQLAPFETRRNNTPLPYTPSLQLTVESPDGKNHIQRAPYTSMLYENMKKLSTVFFESRGSLLQVEKLIVSASDCVLRFPVDLRVHVQNLKIEIRSSSIFNLPNYSALSPVIIKPLNSLEIRGALHDLRNLEHEIVKEAKQLIIGEFWERWLDTWKNLKNRKVHLKDDNHRFTSEHFIQLIDDWLVNGKPVGRCYTFAMDSEMIQETVRHVKWWPEVIEKSESSVSLSMKNGSKLVVSSEIGSVSSGVLKMKVIRSRQ